MGRWPHDNDLSLAVFGFLMLFLLGQTITGWKQYNEKRQEHGRAEVALTRCIGTAHCAGAGFENWESELLQMVAYAVFTAFLLRHRSPESKDPEDKDDPKAPGSV